MIALNAWTWSVSILHISFTLSFFSWPLISDCMNDEWSYTSLVNFATIHVPDRVFRSSRPSSTYLWECGVKENMYRCIVAVVLCYLNLWCASLWFISAWFLGLWIYRKICASQAEDSQAKPSSWEALRSVLKSYGKVNVNQSALGQKPGWTHLLCAQVCISF